MCKAQRYNSVWKYYRQYKCSKNNGKKHKKKCRRGKKKKTPLIPYSTQQAFLKPVKSPPEKQSPPLLCFQYRAADTRLKKLMVEIGYFELKCHELFRGTLIPYTTFFLATC